MGSDNSNLTFYKQTNDKSEITGDSPRLDKRIIGPNLKEVFNVLDGNGLKERAHMYEQEGGWSGDLYAVNRRLFMFQNELSRFMGDSGAGGPTVANVYEVTMDSTNGWSQYLSVVLNDPNNEKVAREMDALNFAPKHSYLAKNDPALVASREGLWLDDLVEFPSLPR